MSDVRPFLLAGKLVTGAATWSVTSPYDGTEIATVGVASRAQVEEAVAAAADAAEAARSLPGHARAEVLERICANLETRRGELVETLAREAGKPIAAARAEVGRLLFTLRDGAEQARRISGELLELDGAPQGAGRIGLVRRFPLSVVSGIVPFNFPLNLAAHKLAPAIAAGASIVLKPPPQDPLTCCMLAEAAVDVGYPAGALSIIPCEVEDAAPLIDDERVRMISFTGSVKAGWAIRERASRKRVSLELGGSAPLIIHDDADVEAAARRAVVGGYHFAGQSCISVQRILVQESVRDAFLRAYVPLVERLRLGDPLDERTEVGPMIDERSAVRAESWVREAVSAGAELAVGGGRNGALLHPVLLLNTDAGMRVNAEEIFAPVTTVRSYGTFDEALAMANESRYGLQVGVYTSDVRRIMRAWDQLDVGGIIANDIPSWRVDQMPYGGVKDSGIGREGVRYAMQDMTEPRLLVLHR